MSGKATLYARIDTLEKEQAHDRELLTQLALSQADATRWHQLRTRLDLSPYRPRPAGEGEARAT